MDKVIAVIVTHNRQAMLSNCIDALRKQTYPLDAILVVNNASTDNTAFWLDNQMDVEHLIQENLGSAGGFESGIEWAYQRGFTWMWCMEDDSVPAVNALEKLMDQDHGQTVLLNSILVNQQDRSTLLHPVQQQYLIQHIQEDMLEGVAYPFNGTLIHRSIVTKVGLPNGAMYMQGAETEYFYRITKLHRIPVKTIVASIHYANPSNTISMRHWDADYYWKFYFFIKNRKRIFELKYGQPFFSHCCFVGQVFNWMIRTIFSTQPQRRKKINLMLSAMIDAFATNHALPSAHSKKYLHQQSLTLVPRTVAHACRKAYYTIFFPSAYWQQDSMAA